MLELKSPKQKTLFSKKMSLKSTFLTPKEKFLISKAHIYLIGYTHLFLTTPKILKTAIKNKNYEKQCVLKTSKKYHKKTS